MTDAFDSLGLEPCFDLDLAHAEERHRTLSGVLHPDRYVKSSASERRLALGRAIEVNQAWRTLRDPILRAECLLIRAGVPVGEGREPKPSPELLMAMMEAREELSDANKLRDFLAIERFAASMKLRERELVGSISRAFAVTPRDAVALTAVLPELGALRYVRRFLADADAMLEDRES
ncbi:MAG: Fe-S protein assembly co-chaperone HscB [Myxococcales bacterium]|nr:Fe-S protein assembly co-chaperone HscB [Myxococcales bacterium]